MCGIVGYIGKRSAQPIILGALKRLEYRGYDSCGFAVLSNGKIEVFKERGSIDELEKALSGVNVGGTVGVGHTRWATHGEPSRRNAHPHTDCKGDIAVVHNGIIENFQHLRETLAAEGHVFRSDTDTEVVAHLVERYYNGNLEEAVRRALHEVKGSYALAILHKADEKIVAARSRSPLVLGVGDSEFFVASDVPALLEHTNRVVHLEDGDLVIITREGFRIENGGNVVPRKMETVLWSIEDAERGGYEHFMLKEIHETPRVIENTLATHLRDGVLGGVDLDLDVPQSSEILMVACGTSFHAALVGKYVIEELASVPVRVELASEFNYATTPLSRETLVVGITQSGETADTLSALKRAKAAGCATLAITNVLGSSVTRLADRIIYTRAGPEICVAATKTFTAQLITLYLLALHFSSIELAERQKMLKELRRLPTAVQRVLDAEDEIKEVSGRITSYENVFFIGRGISFPVALEGALKLKEISYIHAEGYAAGELKHGPFALLTEETPVVAVVAPDRTYDIMLNNIKEVKARKPPVIAVADEHDEEIEKYVDFVIRTSHVEPIFSAITNSVALQLLAYYAAKERGCEIDKPRNLAKSVTVE
ncbi:MAG: glutamine--fructose-6-phosphate transaminase (isomerizing) [Candidatus Alkanophagales archaeon]|nr:MAG: glutamine--fructose-6-phosphate transaminase (isomerizing) [Candidatus Alkanophagales archaeon]